jgi:hypothetical protein
MLFTFSEPSGNAGSSKLALAIAMSSALTDLSAALETNVPTIRINENVFFTSCLLSFSSGPLVTVL